MKNDAWPAAAMLLAGLIFVGWLAFMTAKPDATPNTQTGEVTILRGAR